MRIVVVLQNPWKKGELRKGYSPPRWKKEFLSSRTGKRLIRLLGTRAFHVINANPTLTEHATAKPLKPRHDLTSRLNRLRPDLVLLCGRLAFDSINLQKLRSNIVCLLVHHPAFRCYSIPDEAKKARTIKHVLSWVSCSIGESK